MPKQEPLDPRRLVPAPAGYIRYLVQRFGTTPDMRDRLLHGTDVTQEQLADPNAEVTLFTFIQFNENLCTHIGEAWPLEAKAAFSNAMQGALEVAVRSAPTLGDALDVIARFGHVRGPFLSLKLRQEAKVMRLIIRPSLGISDTGWRALSMTAILGVANMISAIVDVDSDRLESSFNWAAPKYADPLRQTLPSPPRYGQPDCSVTIPVEICRRASPFADAALHETALNALEISAGRTSTQDSVVLKLQLLLNRRKVGRLTEEDAAKELALSRRTLVRRLSECGTTFRTLLDGHLKEQARQMIGSGSLSRDQMARKLGFTDPTSFSRACRRWFKALE